MRLRTAAATVFATAILLCGAASTASAAADSTICWSGLRFPVGP